MPTNETDGPAEVSKAAHDRMTKERDDALAKIAELESQVGEATTALSDYQKRDAARSALKDKVANPDAVADMITPFLKDVAKEDVAAHVTSEDFAPRLAAFQPAANPNPDPENGGDPTGTQEPGAGAFGGPSPGNDAGSQSTVAGTEKIVVGSAEYKALLKEGGQAYEAADKQGRIVQPASV